MKNPRGRCVALSLASIALVTMAWALVALRAPLVERLKEEWRLRTCPDPMAALTGAVSAGARRGGYVKFAGYNDGRRLLLPPTSRFQKQAPQ